MNTRAAFVYLHKLQEQDDIKHDLKVWGEATWHLKGDQRRRLTELRK